MVVLRRPWTCPAHSVRRHPVSPSQPDVTNVKAGWLKVGDMLAAGSLALASGSRWEEGGHCGQ